MIEKVQRADLPFRSLRRLNRQVNRKFDSLLRESLQRIHEALKGTTPDVAEGDFIAMSKAFLPEDRGVGLRWWERREIIGAGADVRGALPRNDETDNFLDRWSTNGRMQDRTAVGKKEGKPKEALVMTGAVRFEGGPKVEKVIDILNGGSSVPVVVNDQGVLVVVDGREMVWAARFLGIPAMRVLQYTGTVRGVEGNSLWDDMEFLKQRSAHFVRLGKIFYRMPTSLEPLAQIARETSLEEFVDLLQGELDPALEYAELLREQSNRSQKVWVQVYKYYRERGYSEDEAKEKVENSVEYRFRKKEETEKLEAANVRIEQETTRRGKVAEAEALSVKLMNQDGENVTVGTQFKEPEYFWFRSQLDRSGVFERKSILMGLGLPTFYCGDSVEIKDLLGEWKPGMVVGSGYSGIKVKRTDEQVRNIRRPEEVRKLI